MDLANMVAKREVQPAQVRSVGWVIFAPIVPSLDGWLLKRVDETTQVCSIAAIALRLTRKIIVRLHSCPLTNLERTISPHPRPEPSIFGPLPPFAFPSDQRPPPHSG